MPHFFLFSLKWRACFIITTQFYEALDNAGRLGLGLLLFLLFNKTYLIITEQKSEQIVIRGAVSAQHFSRLIPSWKFFFLPGIQDEIYVHNYSLFFAALHFLIIFFSKVKSTTHSGTVANGTCNYIVEAFNGIPTKIKRSVFETII